MKFIIGTVVSTLDVTKTGLMKVGFDLQNKGESQDEWVRYVTPYGNKDAGFIAIPESGSTVLCAYSDSIGGAGGLMRGYFYMGSLIGVNATEDRLVDSNPLMGGQETSPKGEYIDSEQEDGGVYGPPTKEGEYAMIAPKDRRPFPEAFKELYDAKGFTPEIIGLAGNRGDAALVRNRSRGNKGDLPFQDHMTEIRSGSGKTIRCVDSPIVDGIVMSNEHKGKDYFIFSTGNSEMSPFAEGEFHTRTHGPINTYTLESNIHTWVEDGRNLELENRAGGKYSPSGDRNGSRTTNEDEGSPDSRIDDIGNEDFGCVKVWSHHNNVSISALEDNSVVHVHAPGGNTKVIVKTGGTVDIVADKKITLTSQTEVELNAPMVQLNGSDEVELNGPMVQLNGSSETEINAPLVDVNGSSEVDIDGGVINLN